MRDPYQDHKESIRIGEWRAFDKILHWINTQEDKMISKSKLYAVVMDMRPGSL